MKRDRMKRDRMIEIPATELLPRGRFVGDRASASWPGRMVVYIWNGAKWQEEKR